MPQPGERAVVVVNHVSWLDGLLLAAFLPGKPVFAVHSQVASRWWMAPALKLFRAFPVDPTNPMSTKAMVKAVKDGNTLVIFPEGRITVTGALMKVFDGPGMVADKADAPIIPVRIDGAQYSTFSKLRGKVRLKTFPKITLTVLPPRRFEIRGEMTARARRAIAGRRLYDEMSAMIFATSDTDTTLFDALLDARRSTAARFAVDVGATRLDRLILAAKLLSPHSAPAPRRRRVSACCTQHRRHSRQFLRAPGHRPGAGMLNYTAGRQSEGGLPRRRGRTIVTARAFIAQAKSSRSSTARRRRRQIVWLETSLRVASSPVRAWFAAARPKV